MEAEQNTRLFGNGDTHGTTGLTLCLFMGNVFPLTSSSSSQLKREVPVYKGRGPGLNSRRLRSVASVLATSIPLELTKRTEKIGSVIYHSSVTVAS